MRLVRTLKPLNLLLLCGFSLAVVWSSHICSPSDHCSLDCAQAPYACNGTIDASGAESLALNCNTMTACANTTVYLPQQLSNDHLINITCNNELSCQNTQIYHNSTTLTTGTIIHLSCNENSACTDLMLFAPYVDVLSVDCLHSESCFRMQLHSNNADIVDVVCHNDQSCSQSFIDSQNVTDLHIECNDDGCYNMNIYLPSSPHWNIQFKNPHDMVLYSKNGFDSIHDSNLVFLNGIIGDCNEHQSWMNLNCNPNGSAEPQGAMISVSINDGFMCSADVCGCWSFVNILPSFYNSDNCKESQEAGRNLEIAVVIDVVPKSAGCYAMIVIVVIIMVSYLLFIVIFIILSTKRSKTKSKSTEEEDKNMAKKQKIFGVLHALSAIVPPIFYSKFSNSVFLGILIILFAGCQIMFQFVRHHLTSKNGKQIKMKSSILFVVVGNSLFNISQGSAIIAGVNYDYSNTLILIISSWFAFLGQDLFSILLSTFLEVSDIAYGVGAKAMYFFGFVQIASNSYIYISYLQKKANVDMDLHLFCDLSIEFASCALLIQLLYFIAGIIVFFKVKDAATKQQQEEQLSQAVEKTEPNIEIPTCANEEEVVYLKWRTEDVLEWIINLEDGKFKIYEEELRENLETEKIVGEDIGNLDKSDLHRLGIKEFKLKQSLLQHIESLTEKENK